MRIVQFVEFDTARQLFVAQFTDDHDELLTIRVTHPMPDGLAAEGVRILDDPNADEQRNRFVDLVATTADKVNIPY